MCILQVLGKKDTKIITRSAASQRTNKHSRQGKVNRGTIHALQNNTHKKVNN